MNQIDADVCVVGAGYAGLTAARRLNPYGRLLREPFGRVHWVGTETATISHGAMDGAVRSGERASSEILSRV